jgi:nitroreductase
VKRPDVLHRALCFLAIRTQAAAKVIALDAGHVCQNLYLACEAIGAGTCAVAAYDQQAMDHILKVDGKDEFTIYLASVGKRRS